MGDASVGCWRQRVAALIHAKSSKKAIDGFDVEIGSPHLTADPPKSEWRKNRRI
jgi:hypothetical protein